MGALGKLFSEVVENIDMKPVEGVIATGGNWVQAIRFAVLPQVLSNFVSYGLLRFEINVRGAAVMGFVGAGGIGQDLIEAIRKFYYSDVSAILVLLICHRGRDRPRHRAHTPRPHRPGYPKMNATAQPARTMREIALADQPGLMARHPEVFRPDYAHRIVVIGTVAALLAVFFGGLAILDISWVRVANGMGRLGHFVELMVPPAFGTLAKLQVYLWSLAETLAIAFLGTLLAATLALPFGFMAASNVIPGWVFRFVTRRFLDTVRSVDTLIWALIWINVVGLGPFAGILAIMTSDFGAFGKLFSEAIEAADGKAVEGVTSAGGHRVHSRPLRPAAAGAARLRQPDPLLFRIQYPLGHHHRHRRRRRYRHAPLRADQGARMAVTSRSWCCWSWLPSPPSTRSRPRLRFAIIGQPGGQH